MKNIIRVIMLILTLQLCNAYAQWNNPHIGKEDQNTLHGAFTSAPKTLDPARAYSSDEMQFISQIVEPPLQYHYLKRPYALIPLTLTAMPTITYLDKNNHPLSKNAPLNQIAYTVYDLHIKPGIYYQPHPAFIKQSNDDMDNANTLYDFKKTGTRELTADDYVYQIKRLASPSIHSPIFGVMSDHIVGFLDYSKTLQNAMEKQKKRGVEHPFLDLRQYPLTGATAISKYHYQIKIKGIYPQFLYWLAMPFFSPMPWEADQFYAHDSLRENNITLDWYPIGTGPYLLAENNPNKQMILAKNPNFHGESFPSEGEPSDQKNHYLDNAGKPMPFVDQFIFTLDKESIPRWNKFLQGYYDQSGISADSFDQAIKLDKNGDPLLTDDMKQKGIRLQTSVSPSVFYIGFNMLDDVVGGYSEKNTKLRQAISIALDYEEYIQLFMNGRGIAAQSPIPPGIFGYESGKNGMNNVVYVWENGKAKRKSIEIAKQLMSEAGYPNGIDPKTHKPLILNYDVTSSGNPDDKSRFNWMRKQFAKLGIELNIRQTEYNRFQDKVRTGQAQIFSWGWLADYPDPENFLFVLYGQNGKVKFGGENAANYANPAADQLFDEIKNMPNNPERLKKIRELLHIIQHDSPWIFGVHPIDFTLTHQWVTPAKPNSIANNILKYQQINPALRAQLRHEWNKPILWPLWIFLGFLVVIFIPLVVTYWKRENNPTVRRSR